ncbi:hypothetical protein ACFHWD_20215 [Clostridium sp. MT-14]|jgi:hypothetical protein|uniref:Uncharacterized protein n=1 Tax=Clostridium aromativorans TaxID=2836848 RepID=A0ABS8NAK5_9CLOT|nr:MULTISPECIES: hypothetical protein [Clostridium]KAA8665315.1 hypothetical protein F3O63_17230 [Clostridium sp. HV4-5-A1G]MCC9296832.1 hypothetical protein [Clostridium aromativorans]CAB1249451.1 conserved exported hypothetical protein [Clostridiaceae bacterium BL-3]
MTRHKLKKALSLLLLTTVFSVTTFSSVSASSIVNSESAKFVPMLGGGPSPSAAWTYRTSYYHTFTHNQLRTLNNKYQSTIRSSTYVAGQYAYNVSVVALGFMGKSGAVAASYISLFGQTYFSKIQSSANVIASAYGKGGSVRLKVIEYYRPASGEKMIIFA